MSMILEDPVKRMLSLDLFRLDIGTESIDVRAGWRLGRHVTVYGLYKYGLLGDSQADGKAEVKLSDSLLLVPEIENLVRGQQTEQESITRGKAQLKLRLLVR
jgi:hypothetical protein